jgi:predicted HicB family RNase H-like nuclease
MIIINSEGRLSKVKKYILSLPDELHAKLKIQAVKEGVTMNEVILNEVQKQAQVDEEALVKRKVGE